MENELLKQTKRHFSKLGFMYFLGTLIIFAGQTLTSIIIQRINPDILANNNLSLLVLMLPMYAITMPLMALLIRTIPAEAPEKHKMTLGQWLIAFIMCYALVYISNLIGQFVTFLIGTVKGSAVTNAIVEIAGGISPWVSILIMVLLAPLAEELLFRKLLIDRTIHYGEGTAVLFSGLMFGLFHGNLNQFAYAFMIGLFFGFIYVKTGKIIYTVFMHMLINFMGSVVSMLLLNNSGYSDIAAAMNDPSTMMNVVMEHLPQLILFLVYVLGILGITIAGLILLIVKFKQFNCKPGALSVPKGKRFTTMILNVGMLLFSLYWILQIILQLFQ